MYNELQEPYKDTDIVTVVRAYRLRWLGHIMRIVRIKVARSMGKQNRREKNEEEDRE